jgi:hypothetical protein
MGWVVSITPRPRFTPGERTPSTHWTGGWVGPRSSLDAEARRKILSLCRGLNFGRPVRSQPLYSLSYPGGFYGIHEEMNSMELKSELLMPSTGLYCVSGCTVGQLDMNTASFLTSPVPATCSTHLTFLVLIILSIFCKELLLHVTYSKHGPSMKVCDFLFRRLSPILAVLQSSRTLAHDSVPVSCETETLRIREQKNGFFNMFRPHIRVQYTTGMTVYRFPRSLFNIVMDLWEAQFCLPYLF